GAPDGAAEEQDRHRLRHGASAVHVDHRAALEGLSGMDAPTRAGPPHAVLFACAQNAVRSPMAAAMFRRLFGQMSYSRSAGARKGEADPFAVAVMDEIGIDLSKHRPRTFEELEDLDGL